MTTPEVTPDLTLGKLYLVTWIDSSFIKGWQYPELGGELAEPRQIESVGWLFAVASDHLVLAPSRTTDSAGVLNTLAIPLGCITSQKEIA